MTPDSHDKQVLHFLRCVGVVSSDRLGNVSGMAGTTVGECLEHLAAQGLAQLDPGPFGGWGITDVGRTIDSEWLTRQLDGPGVRERIHTHYDQFLALNPDLLQVCSDWQIRTLGGSPTLNDHSDADYDAKVLTRLIRIDESAEAVCEGLAGTLDRFSIYTERLPFALERALAGDHDYVADGLDSYHSVWFQLHEDLLTTLGISRDEERNSTS